MGTMEGHSGVKQGDMFGVPIYLLLKKWYTEGGG